MFEKLMKYLPMLIILYAGNEVYTLWVEHTENLENRQNAIPNLETRIARLKRERKEVDTYMQDIESAKKRIELVAQEV
jgi:hypothetical protein